MHHSTTLQAHTSNEPSDTLNLLSVNMCELKENANGSNNSILHPPSKESSVSTSTSTPVTVSFENGPNEACLETKGDLKDQHVDTLMEPVVDPSTKEAKSAPKGTEDTTVTLDNNAGAVTQEATDTIVPNRTLYINNLNSKIPLPQLKKDLQGIFSNFGAVRQIVAMSSFWRRGQAWVVFAEQESANKALLQLQGFPYANKEMRIQYARELSDIFTKEAGTFIQRPPGPKKPRAIIEREKKLQNQLQHFQKMVIQHMHQQNVGGDTPNLTQPLQAASAIAAQVQQVMQQPSLLAMFPNAIPSQYNATNQQKQQMPQGHLHEPFSQMHTMRPYHSSSTLPNTMPGHFQSMTVGRTNTPIFNASGGPHSGRKDNVMGGPKQQQQLLLQQQLMLQQQQQQPQQQQQTYMMNPARMMGCNPNTTGGLPHDMKSVGPPLTPMSKDAVVAAATAAAAAISAAKKRATETTFGRQNGATFASSDTKPMGFTLTPTTNSIVNAPTLYKPNGASY
ncbi:ataxin-2 homolog isoform X2 [Hylaeus volcanicus]|uniref:ataxin-2 homolog isoform X2 n=1 Tax=Hylaeus volcanicus TaxID=313075 RepID=UPI0023B7B2F9|nr:ataxin-2 homolog isoform X2 [Hylaeus volcanicus]